MRYLFAVLALALVILLHELGHLLAARLFRIRVRRFSIGFGPPMFTLHRGGIDWVLAAIPLGGSAKLYGANPHEPPEVLADKDAFLAHPWWQRLLVHFAGSLLNLLVAFAVVVALFVSGTHVPVRMTVGTVDPGSEAARAQLRPGDRIVTVDGEVLDEWGQLVQRVHDSPNRSLFVELLRGTERVAVQLTPRPDEGGIGRVGISQQYVFREHPLGEATSLAADYLGRLVRDGAAVLWRFVRGDRDLELASPVIIVKQASDVAALGWDAFLRVFVHLSIALAAFQLLPFPSLDGGRMVLVAIAAARKRPVSPRVETALHLVGFLLLLAAIVAVVARGGIG